MRRFATFLVLMLFSVPLGISITGCAKKTTVTYCNASTGAGVVVGQLNRLVLQPITFGVSLNYGQIGQVSTPAGTDCQGNSVSVSSFTYATRDISIVDINPATGALCAGSWNRKLNVIPDFTVCTPPATPSAANSVTYITATAQGVTSNPIPVYIHPVVTSIVLGTPSSNCSTDPTTNCCPLAANNIITAPAYSGNSCISQTATGQLVARVFAQSSGLDPVTGATTTNTNNISCQVGHLVFAAQNPAIVSIDENGVATAQQPGSTVINASIANAGSSAGFFSTCPPASITLNVPNTNSTSIAVNQNFSQPLVATVVDTNGKTLTGLNLEYVSTTPTTIPVASNGIVTPSFPGGASITAICQPPSCNPAPFNQIGLFNNGKPVTSNPIGVSTPGTNSTLLYIASTGSRYLVPVDFTTTTLGTPVQLPYAPNSMVISNDGSSIYMGSTTELMVFNATADSITREDVTVPGTVLGVSPDNSTIAVSDPNRKLIYLVATTANGSIITQYGGVGTHAQWTPDSQTVYITAADPATGANQLLVYANFTGWNNITPNSPLTSPIPNPTAPLTGTNFPLDVAVTVPSVGAYFAGTTYTTAVSYCAASTPTTTNGQTTVGNIFNPNADSNNAKTDRIAATNDGHHILGATAANKTLSDLFVTLPTGPCPATGGLQFSSAASTIPLPTIAPTAITSVQPTSDSTAVIVTYTGTGGVLPAYTPSTAGTATPGTLTNIPLTGTATAPVAGVWSTDNLTFFAGTSGDNLVHLITRPSSTAALTDSKSIIPALPGLTGGIATPNLIVQHPRKTT